MKDRRLSLLLAALLAAPAGAAEPALTADVAVSTPAAKSGPVLRIEPVEAPSVPGPRRRSIGLGWLLKEGKPLEISVWGTGGAVAGSVAGPGGALIGAGAGALCGLLYSVFVVPHNGPEPKPKQLQ